MRGTKGLGNDKTDPLGPASPKTYFPNILRTDTNVRSPGNDSSAKRLPTIKKTAVFVTNTCLEVDLHDSPQKNQSKKDVFDDDDYVSAVLSKRAARAKIRKHIRRRELDVLKEGFASWRMSYQQQHLANKAATVQRIFGSFVEVLTIEDVWNEWNIFRIKRHKMKANESKIVAGTRKNTLILSFVRWQVLWAGCTDWRPAKAHKLLISDFKKNRISNDDMIRLMSSEKGRLWARGASQAECDVDFRDAVESAAIDLETLGELTIQVFEDIAKVSKADSQRLYNRIQKELKPDFVRLGEVLESNAITQNLLDEYIPLVEHFSNLVNSGSHPLGPTKEEMLLATRRDAIQNNNTETIKVEVIPDASLLLDFCVRAADGGEVRSITTVGVEDSFSNSWSRGYQILYSDHIHGEIKLQNFDVELILPPSSKAFAFVVDTQKCPGELLHHSDTILGDSFIPKKYRFELQCSLKGGMAVMVHLVSGPSPPARYICWKRATNSERRINAALSIRSVNCSRKAELKESDLHIAMWFLIEIRRGQEMMKPGWTEEELNKSHGQNVEEQDRTELESGSSSINTDKRNRVRFDAVTKDSFADKVLPEVMSDHELTPNFQHNFGGYRCWTNDLKSDVSANIACTFNPKYKEIWICTTPPCSIVHSLEKTGRLKKSFEMPPKFVIASLSVDLEGKVYACDGAKMFFKILHERFWDSGSRKEADRFSRLWVTTAPEGSFPTSIAVPPRMVKVCYALYLNGPIWVLDSADGTKTAEIVLDPPPSSASFLVVTTNVFVVCDGHAVKVYNLSGTISSVLGQCYCDPCLFCTGDMLFVADRNAFLWDCYASGMANGTELSQQKESALRARKLWTRRERAVTPNSKFRVDRVIRQVGEAMDMEGRPLSRALGDSSSLAYSQGLSYFNSEENRYEAGRFFTDEDRQLRKEMSELKQTFPMLPVDPGNLFRAF